MGAQWYQPGAPAGISDATLSGWALGDASFVAELQKGTPQRWIKNCHGAREAKIVDPRVSVINIAHTEFIAMKIDIFQFLFVQKLNRLISIRLLLLVLGTFVAFF